MRTDGWKRVVVALLGVAVLGGCGNDTPTSVGGPLFPSGLVRTFEIVLDAPQFLVGDTALTGYVTPAQSGLMVVAQDFEGTLDAHALMRFSTVPKTVSYNDSTGTARTDTLPSYKSGSLIFYTDSSSLGGTTATLELDVAGEEWDPISADWQNRVDTTGVTLPWSQPGGTPGQRLATAKWDPGADSVVFRVDSQTVELWRDTAVVNKGMLILSQTAGVRLEAARVILRLDAVPSQRTDTVVTVDVPQRNRTFVYDPPPPPSQALRIGGIPTWQSALEMRSRLDTLKLPCPGMANCMIPLNRATITTAELLLQPLPPVPGYRPGDTLRVESRPIIRSPLLPLARSPLGDPVTALRPGVGPSAFTQPAGDAPRFAIPVTSFVARLAVTPSDTTGATSFRTLMLLPFIQTAEFGFGAFGSTTMGALAPKLRLVLTVSQQELIQ